MKRIKIDVNAYRIGKIYGIPVWMGETYNKDLDSYLKASSITASEMRQKFGSCDMRIQGAQQWDCWAFEHQGYNFLVMCGPKHVGSRYERIFLDGDDMEEYIDGSPLIFEFLKEFNQ